MQMESTASIIGKRIKNYRKLQHMTLQNLADQIHKSRATVCKYENGEISIDVSALYDISCALNIPMNKLTDIPLPETESAGKMAEEFSLSSSGRGPFFNAKRLYFYFYDGRYSHLKDGIITIKDRDEETGSYNCTLSISVISADGRSSEIFYTGKVYYSDILIRFSFINSWNILEEALLYIFNPLEIREQTTGLLCGISTADLAPCTFKCLLSLKPVEPTKEFISQLLFTEEEMKTMKKRNRFLITNTP